MKASRVVLRMRTARPSRTTGSSPSAIQRRTVRRCTLALRRHVRGGQENRVVRCSSLMLRHQGVLEVAPLSAEKAGQAARMPVWVSTFMLASGVSPVRRATAILASTMSAGTGMVQSWSLPAWQVGRHVGGITATGASGSPPVASAQGKPKQQASSRPLQCPLRPRSSQELSMSQVSCGTLGRRVLEQRRISGLACSKSIISPTRMPQEDSSTLEDFCLDVYESTNACSN